MMVDQIFLSPQVKRTVIVSNKLIIYELAHKLPSDLRLSNVRKSGSIRKTHENYGLSQIFCK